MNLRRHLFLSFIILFSLPSTYYLGEASGYNAQANNILKQTPEDLTMHRFGDDEEDCPSILAAGPGGLTSKTVSVDDFGAKGDRTDDSEAFEKAWEQACSSADGVALIVPKEKSYSLKPIRFTGPCKSNLTVEIHGTIEASDDQSDYNKDSGHWLVFDDVESIVVEGGGTISGNRKIC